MEQAEPQFDSIKHIDNKSGEEYWLARELQPLFDYKEWRKFEGVVKKSITSCKRSGINASDHFVRLDKMVQLGSGSVRSIHDYRLTRYACYIIAQNGDPHKKPIALAQSYFAIKTRQQELIANYNELAEDERRLNIRSEMKKRNASLSTAAHGAGVRTQKDYAIFTNSGYQGLYGGLSHNDIQQRKGLSKNQHILDYMGGSELAANIFRATQTAEKIQREHVQGKDNANKTHHEVGAKIRQLMKELGNVMPEELPTPEKSINQLETEHKQRQQLNMPNMLDEPDDSSN